MTPESLTVIARRVRERILSIVYRSGSGHVGAALSQADLLVALYEKVLRIDAADPRAPDRDRFVLSKGHGGLGLAAVLAERGFVSQAELDTFGESGSALGMHMDHRRVAGIESATGSLGHGLGIALGMAVGARVQAQGSGGPEAPQREGAASPKGEQARKPFRTFCLLSDGECYEGSTWEAVLAAPALSPAPLVAIVDRNRLTMDGFTEKEVPLEPLAEKWRAFGWRVLAIDGHSFPAILGAFDEALAARGPAVIVAETVKGKGVDFMENQPKWHYGALDSDLYARAVASVGRA